MKHINIVPLVVGVLTFSVFLCAAIYAWQEPGDPPTVGMINAPINTSNNPQGKLGNLGIGTTNPTTKLEIAQENALKLGNLYLSSGFSDVASLGANFWYGGGAYHIADPSKGSAALQLLGGNQFQFSQRAAGAPSGSWTIPFRIRSNGDVSVDSRLCLGGECCANWDDCIAFAGPGGASCESVVGGSCLSKSCCSPLSCDTTSKTCVSTGGPGPGPGGVPPQSPCVDPIGGATSGNKRIFVTSRPYTAAEISDDAKADSACASAVSGAGLKDAGGNKANFVAMVYVGGRDPKNIMPTGATFNGEPVGGGICKWHPVATSAIDFLNEEGGKYIASPIVYNEWGNAVNNTKVWTGFKPAGVSGAELLLNTANYGTRSCDGSYNLTTPRIGPCFSIQGSKFVGCPYGACTARCGESKYWYGNTSGTGMDWAYQEPVYVLNGYGTINTCATTNSHPIYCVEI